MRPSRTLLRLLAIVIVVTLLCSVALMYFASSLMFTQLRSNAAVHMAFLRGESRSSMPQYGFDFVPSDDITTGELIKIASQNEKNESNCLTPMHVHLLWIGDVDKAPPNRLKYTEMGYNLTVHTSAEEILDGFHPYVLKAFRQAIPNVVGYDFLKFAMLYKYGGISADADTFPAIPASEIQWPADCDVVFGKEVQIGEWEKPIYRESGGNNYGLNRPFQILNWAMAVNKPRNPHIKYLIRAAMMHFFGRRDMEQTLIQDISGSGLMTDYVALLYEQEGLSYPEIYRDTTKYYPVQGLCLTDGYFRGDWIHHSFLNSWQ